MRAPLDRRSARVSLIVNLLTVPGLGSLRAGRYIAGALQMALSITGFLLAITWMLGMIVQMFETFEFPSHGGAHARLGLLGVALFATGWFWSLATGLSLMRAASRVPPKI